MPTGDGVGKNMNGSRSVIDVDSSDFMQALGLKLMLFESFMKMDC